MEETTTPHICDDHYFVPAEVEESFEEEDVYGRIFTVTRWACPVAGCGAMLTEEELLG